MAKPSRSGIREQILKAAKADPAATHEQIAQRVGCHPSTVGKYVKGRSRGRPQDSAPPPAGAGAGATLKTLTAPAAAAPAANIAMGEFAGNGIRLQRGADGRWERVDTIATSPLGQMMASTGSASNVERAAEQYTDTMAAVIVGQAAAETLNDGMVAPEDLPKMLEFVDKMVALGGSDSGSSTDETGEVDLGIEVPDGTMPVAWKAAALHTVYHVVRDADAAWQDWEGDEIPTRPSLRLVEDRFFDADPLIRAAEAEADGEDFLPPESCIDRALFRLSAAEHTVMPNYPLEMMPVDADTTHSPQTVADRTGFGSRIGGDLGAAARLYDAHEANHGYVQLSGLIITSQAHITEPGSDEFDAWLHKNVLPTEEERASEHYIGDERNAIGGVLDICVLDEPDSGVALGVLDRIHDLSRRDFEDAVADYYSFDVEGEDEICEALASKPHLAASARKAIKDFEATKTS